MAQYRKLILTKINQNYPELNYNSTGYYGMDRYYSTEPYQSYSDYDFPVKPELSNKSFEYTYTQGPSNRIIFRSYFRPISDNDNISEYNKNKYGHIQYPKELYYISICPHCGSKNKFMKPNYERRTYQKNVNINKSQQLCPNCRYKILANQNYRMNMAQNLNRTFSPKENQSIYLMPYGQKDSSIKKCTCKRRTINLPQNTQNNKIILTEDKDIVNQKSKNLKTETIMDSLDSNAKANIISKEKEDVVNNELNNNINVNDNKNENAEINNNLDNDGQKKNINQFALQENLNLNEQNVDLNKNINDIGEDENDNVKEPDMNGDMNHNDLIEEKEENVHEDQNLHLEENNNLDSRENKNLDLGENKNLDLEKNIELNNDNIEKENQNNIPQDLNENENKLNKINQNEGEQNELLNYYRNKDDEVNYYDNENENENIKENKLLNSNENENKGFINDGNENEDIKNEKIENNENININEDEQNDKYKIKYSEIERDDIPDNKNGQNILNDINTNDDSANKKEEQEQEQENLQQTHDNNINANNMEHLENEVEENKDNNFNQNEIIENENNDLGNEQNQLLNKDNLENEEKNNEDKDVNMENEALDAKVNLNEEENQYMNQNGDNEKEENININKSHQIEGEIDKEDNNVNVNEEEEQDKLNQKISQEESNLLKQVENDVIGDNGKKDEDNNEDNGNVNENNDNMNKFNINNINMNNVNLDNVNMDNNNMDNDNMDNANIDNEKMDNDKLDNDNIDNANINIIKDSGVINDNMNNGDDNNKKENVEEYEEIDNENKGMNGKKNIKNSQKSSGKTKPKIPQSGELLFNPKKSKKRNYKPLFNKYELEELNNRHRQGMAFQEGESVFKKAKEIFPSKYGIEMPYKSPVRQSNYSVNSLSRRSMEKSIKRKTISEKKNKSQMKYDEETPIKEFDYNSQKNGQFKIQKYEKKNYYMYKSNIKSDNPFEGLSLYNKNTKERKSLIAKKVEKEENEYNEINLLEGSIIKNKDLNEEELNQLIIKISKFMYENEEKNLENKELYEYKIHRVSNIIKFMNDEAQKKILEELQKNAKDEYSTKLFEILKSKIDEYKEKLIKSYKIEETSKNGAYSFKLYSPAKKVFKKSLRKSNK